MLIPIMASMAMVLVKLDMDMVLAKPDTDTVLTRARYGHGLGYYNVYYGKRSADAEPTAVAHHYNSGYDNNGFALEGYFMHQCDPPSDGDGCPDCGQVLIKAMKAHWPCF